MTLRGYVGSLHSLAHGLSTVSSPPHLSSTTVPRSCCSELGPPVNHHVGAILVTPGQHRRHTGENRAILCSPRGQFDSANNSCSPTLNSCWETRVVGWRENSIVIRYGGGIVIAWW